MTPTFSTEFRPRFTARFHGKDVHVITVVVILDVIVIVVVVDVARVYCMAPGSAYVTYAEVCVTATDCARSDQW